MTDFNAINAENLNIIAAGARPFGQLVWWSMGANRVTHETLVDQADKAGVDAKLLPKRVRPLSAWKRACQSVGSSLGEGRLLREVMEDAHRSVVGVIRETRDEQTLQNSYSQEYSITFDKQTHTIATGYSNGVSAALQANYLLELDHGTGNIRGIISKLMDQVGVQLKPSGGVYYVPESEVNEVQAVERLYSALNPGNMVYPLQLVDLPEARMVLRSAVAPGLEEELRQLSDKLEAYDFGKASSSSIGTKLAEIEAFQAKVSLFSGVLDMSKASLHEKLRAMLGRISVAIGGGLKPGVDMVPDPKPDTSTPVPTPTKDLAWAEDAGF